ncbi:MAG: DNA polymerase III subunit beta, partial [Chloroflexota bacterium]
MRVICLQENLQRALGIAGRAVATKSTLPVLGNFLLEAEDDHLTISGTNLEMGIIYTIPATVEEPGKATLQARVLSDFVASLPSGEVELFEDSGPTTMLVKHGSTQAHVRGQDPNDFPELTRSVEEGGQTIRLDPETLIDAIEQTVFAAATDDSRPVLAGVQIESHGEDLTFAAADGFRMSVRTVKPSSPVEGDLSIIVPARAMQELARVVGDTEEEVALHVTPNGAQLVAEVPDVTFYTRLIDGTFPDLSKIIPTDWTTRAVIGRDVLLDATRRSSIFARSSNDVVKVAIGGNSGDDDVGHITISATAADTGDNRDEIDAQIDGNDLEVAFNARYLSDLLSVVHSPSVAMELQGPNAAG